MAEMLGTLPGVAYVTRGHVVDVAGIRRAKKAIKMAFRAQMEELGFSMVEILSTCYTNWGLTVSDAMKWAKEHMIPYYPVGDTCISDAMKGWR
jgi:2-oxoglutarate ferredoxin oxidoreductase subunit beta